MTEVEVTDERAERLRNAIQNGDKRYLESYEQGLASGEAGYDYSLKKSLAWKDGYEAGQTNYRPDDEGEKMPGDQDDVVEEEELVGSPINVGFHPLGGILVQVRQVDGTVAQARLTVEQAGTVIWHMQALITMLLQTMYAQVAMQQEDLANKGIVTPGR